MSATDDTPGARSEPPASADTAVPVDPTVHWGHSMGGFMRDFAFTWDLVSPDRLEAHLDADERHHQPYGIVHGGVYCSIVETMASVGSMVRAKEAGGGAAVGASNTTDFLRPHRTGRLDAVAEPLHAGRTQHLWEVRITNQDGRTVAAGRVRMQMLDEEPAHRPRPAEQVDGPVRVSTRPPSA